MSLKAKQQPETELDHIRDTLTDIVGVVGETRRDVKELKQEQTEMRKEQAEMRKEQAEMRKEQTEMRKDIAALDRRFDQLELLIRQLLPNANN